MDFLGGYDQIDLCGEWRFAYTFDDPGEIKTIEDIEKSGMKIMPCKVPGNFELDLLANGVIEEPFHGMNIASLTKYERARIYYFTEFDADERAGFEPHLVFEGIDCFSLTHLNGVDVCSTDNMLIPAQAGTHGCLKGRNQLLVHISPEPESWDWLEYPPSVYAMRSNWDSLYTRKAPHMYGWDIMPRALSAGIWRDARLVYKPVERIEWVYLQTPKLREDQSEACLKLSYNLQIADRHKNHYNLIIEGSCGESTFSHTTPVLFHAGATSFQLPSPKLWWPKGKGEQNLYDITVTLAKNGEVIDTMKLTHGIRTIELLRTSTTDEDGNGEFCFKVNGEKVFVHGTNWVPADAYHSRDVDRIPQMLEMADDLNCNMIRCWGGNVYENNLFFDICDRKGIMVWQDFAMACALYPQEDHWFGPGIAEEAQQVVQRLRQHACVVLWAGDNECDVFCAGGDLHKDPNYNKLTRQVIPDVVAEEDPWRPYLPSSPYVDPEAFKNGLKYLPEDHLWGPRDYYKSDYYQKSLCHFASEIGYHGCPSPGAIRKFISPEKVWPYTDNEEWTLHCTSPIPGIDLYDYRVELMAKQARVLFGEAPDNLSDYAFASQVSQAEAKKFFIEMFRSQMWRRTGIIWWNLIDGWPQFSDAIVGYYFDRKLAYEFIKRVQQPICLILTEPENDTQRLVSANETREETRLSFTITDVGSGEVVSSGEAISKAESVTQLTTIPYHANKQRFYAIEWQANGVQGRNHYLAGKPPFNQAQYREWLLKFDPDAMKYWLE